MISCEKILDLPYANQFRVLAGHKNLNRKIRWVHYLEDPAYVQWVKGGELIIISGSVIKDDSSKLIKLMDQLYDKDVAGIVINLSSYIPSVSSDIIKEAEELEIPLFEMPAEVRIVDISQSICYAIFQQQQQEMQSSNIILEILYGRRITQNRIQKLADYGIINGKRYTVVIMNYTDIEKSKIQASILYDENVRQQNLELLSGYIKKCIDALNNTDNEIVHYTIAIDDDCLLLFLEESDKEKYDDLLYKLWKEVDAKYPTKELKIAIGESFESIYELKKTVENTKDLLRMLTVAGIIDIKSHILNYMVNQLDNVDNLKNIVNLYLGELLIDENKELLETLIAYYNNNKHIKDTAKNLYVHTNTIHYRLKRIEEILKIDLEDYHQEFQLQICIKLNEILNHIS